MKRRHGEIVDVRDSSFGLMVNTGPILKRQTLHAVQFLFVRQSLRNFQ